jgi:transcriptional regulator, GntR family
MSCLMSTAFSIAIDRSEKASLAEQIRMGVMSAIHAGVLKPGARLPSWRVLAAQLGVARGTVRLAYDRLQDSQLIVAAGAAGTRVADRLPRACTLVSERIAEEPLPSVCADLSPGTGIFQVGVPALECFPAGLFARIRAKVSRSEFAAYGAIPDPRGELELRREIAAHVALSRSLECLPSQVIITSGFAGALGLVLRALGIRAGSSAWMEDPGYPVTRRALELAELTPVPVQVDEHGMDIGYGIGRAPDAALAVVTAGQQAPLGPTLPLARRVQLLEWAAERGAWVIEDDHLGDLQLRGRAAPSLGSLDRTGRVIHIGSFSKTLSPTLRLGFVVVPLALAEQFGDAATCIAPAPGTVVQMATAAFMRDGHYLRHLRRMKRIYAKRHEALAAALEAVGLPCRMAGLSMLVGLPAGACDVRIAREAASVGLAPSPLSPWYGDNARGRSGLLLGIATVPDTHVRAWCERLRDVIERHA